MSYNNKLSPTNRTVQNKDMYWFAHGGESVESCPQSREPVNDVENNLTNNKHHSLMKQECSNYEQNIERSNDDSRHCLRRHQVDLDAYWFAQGGDVSTPVVDQSNNVEKRSEVREGTPPLSQKEREEKIRQFREQQEEERRRRLHELQHATAQAQRFREQLEDERRRKIEELRIKEIERRQGVEERKRMIWEAEQERKEAILRRNLEREARIEARRNAQRNNMSFAFGSSTPRTFDLDLAALGPGRLNSPNTIVFSSSGRHSDERDPGANVFDRKPGDDPMSRSMISLSSASRARRKTDLMPAIPRDNITTRSRSPGNHGKRAVSMTRLDQLAQPRRRHTEASKENATSANNTISADGPRTNSPSMSKSMYNIPSNVLLSQPNKFSFSARYKNGNGMSKSMLHLAESSQKSSKPNHSPYPSNSIHNPPSQSFPNKNLSKSMVHLAIKPRPTRSSRMRAEGLAAKHKEGEASSALVFNRTTQSDSGRLSLSATATKDIPSRPRSSMSATSEQSVTSSQTSVTSVKMRSGPRRARPMSMGNVPPSHLSASGQQQIRQGRSTERKAITPNSRHPRAKSVEQSEDTKSRTPVIRKPAATQKTPKPVEKVIEQKPKEKTPLLQNDTTNVSVKPSEPVTSVEPHSTETKVVESIIEEGKEQQKIETNEENGNGDANNVPLVKPRITSEEEAKVALAEKRRLAREQAEREAELERQRQEELRKQEEERKRQEEEEQRKFEEEQIRLAEIHRLQEEEKLRKAIEDQEQREKEEKEKQEEDARQKAEKDEQERKLREEAEKQRQELEERLRREEAERAERKKRVEQIMSRTRKLNSTPTQGSSQVDGKFSSPEEEDKPLPASSQETTVAESVEAESNILSSDAQPSIQSEVVDGFVPTERPPVLVNGQLNSKEDFQKNWNPFAEQSYPEKTNPFDIGTSCTIDNNIIETQNFIDNSECLLKGSDSGVILADHSPDRTVKLDSIPQSNGYSHHEDDRSFTDSISPEEKSETSVGVLLDFGTVPSPSQNVSTQPISTEFEQLIDIGASMTTNQNEVNLNRISGNPFIAFEEPVSRKQDNSLKDLLL